MRLGHFVSLAKNVALPLVMLAGLLVLSGCETKGWFDPGEMMRTNPPKEGLMVPVLDKLDPRDEVEPEFVNAEDVKQADLKASNTDYIIGRNDLLSVSISEVAGPGTESVKTTRVSESGNISLPLVGSIKAAGQTEAELEKTVAQVYRDRNLIQNAQVSVTVVEARQRTFSILGVVNRPGQYQIIQSDFRLLDAVTMAGDVQVQNIEYVYIIRKESKPEPGKTETTPKTDNTAPPKTKPVDPLEGPRTAAPSKLEVVQAAPQQNTEVALLADSKEDSGGKKVLVDGKWVPVNAGDKAPATKNATVESSSVKTETKVDAKPAAVPAKVDAAAPAATKPFEFDAPRADSDTRVIRVPFDRLHDKGELQYNIIIKPNDTIILPGPKVGEYYMGGHVQRPGVYSLTGRQITLKQAIISAGMIDPLGWPERTEVIRRIGKDKELFVRVNLPKVFAGEQSDIFLRPYDTVNVGTNAIAPFLAAFRGAFRLTYGFGFIYDRNYWNPNNLNNGGGGGLGG